MKGKLRKYWSGALAVVIALALGCAAREDQSYKISELPPANYLTCQRGPADVVRHDESECNLPPPFEGSAIQYLQAITGQGSRRTGTREYRCAAAWVRNQLAFFGYRTEEVTYTFPYYDFDLDQVKVIRVKDGKNFPAFPLHYSLPLNGTITGQLCRPRKNLSGCFVYVSAGLLERGDQKANYAKWKKAGALGMVWEASMRPLATKGLRHSASAHTLSWRYAVLPGVVVERAHELVGETITVSDNARLVQGTGYSVVAQSPAAADRYVLVTGHLDSWFQGALDDGSGVAALLEIANIMKHDPSGVIFLAADSEEIGLVGSAAYVQKYGLDNISAVLELDMASSKNNYGRKTPETAGIMPRFFTVSKGLQPEVKKFYRDLGGRKFYVSVPLTRSLTGMLGTDYEWFYAGGVPGLFIYTPSRYYHTERDTIEWIPGDDLQKVAEDSAQLVRWLRDQARLAPPPEIIPFSFATTQKGATVEFAIKLTEQKKSGPSASPPKVLVRVYFEHGFEDKVDLKKGEDGVWRGEYGLPWPGSWEFLGIVSQGKRFGKRWTTVEATAALGRCAEVKP